MRKKVCNSIKTFLLVISALGFFSAATTCQTGQEVEEDPLLYEENGLPQVVREYPGFKVLEEETGGFALDFPLPEGSDLVVQSGHTGLIECVAYSPDGRYIASGSWNGSVRIWEADTLLLREVFLVDDTVNTLAFSPDGSLLAVGYTGDIDMLAPLTGEKVWNAEGHAKRITREGRGWSSTMVGTVDQVLFNARGDRLISRGTDRIINIFDAKTGEMLRTLQYADLASLFYDSLRTEEDIRLAQLQFIHYREDTLTYAYREGTALNLGSWNTETGAFTPLSKLEVAGRLKSFSPDGEIAAVVSGSWGPGETGSDNFETVHLFDVNTEEEVLTLSPHKHVRGVSIDPEREIVAVSCGYLQGGGFPYGAFGGWGELSIWDIRDKENPFLITRHERSSMYSDADFSPINDTIVVAGYPQIFLYNGDASLESSTADTRPVRPLQFGVSRNGRYMVTGGESGSRAFLWDLLEAKFLRFFEPERFPPGDSLRVSDDGERAYIREVKEEGKRNEHYNLIELDTVSGKVVSETLKEDLSQAPGGVEGVEAKRLQYNRAINGVDIVDPREDVSPVSCVLFADGEWCFFSPDGYFTGSKGIGPHLGLKVGNEVYGIEQFSYVLNRPDIILRRLGNTDQELLDFYYSKFINRFKLLDLDPEEVVKLHFPEAVIKGYSREERELLLDISMRDKKYELQSYNVYINNVPLFGAWGREIDGYEAQVKVKVELAPGVNKIEIAAVNEKGAESLRKPLFIDYEGKVRPDLYYLGFGVSDYEDPDIEDLQYAHKDIEDQAAMFKALEGTSFNRVYSHTYVNEKVSKDTIWKAKRHLSSARPEDVFVLAISGHGVHDRAGTYYFITQNTELADLSTTAAPFDLLDNLFQGISPRRKLFLMDTCESGEFGEESMRAATEISTNQGGKGLVPRTVYRYDSNVEKQRQFLSQLGVPDPRPWLLKRDRFIYNDLLRRSGAVVYSSSMAGQFSFEMGGDIQNGLFTAFILTAMNRTESDANGNGMLSIGELFDYVTEGVSLLSMGKQIPAIDRENSFVDLELPLTDPVSLTLAALKSEEEEIQTLLWAERKYEQVIEKTAKLEEISYSELPVDESLGKSSRLSGQQAAYMGLAWLRGRAFLALAEKAGGKTGERPLYGKAEWWLGLIYRNHSNPSVWVYVYYARTLKSLGRNDEAIEVLEGGKGKFPDKREVLEGEIEGIKAAE
jgi:WD40 repeat protein